MLSKYKKQANIAAIICLCTILVMSIFAVLTSSEDNILKSGGNTKIALTLISLVFMGAFLFSLWAYAKAKGYSGLLGILLSILSVIGLIILVVLRDKHPETLSDERSQVTNATDIGKPRKLWLYVVGILLVGTDAAMFIPAFAGQSVNPQSVFGSILWTGLFFYLWWKRRIRKGWHGALIGSALGLLIFALAAFVSSFMLRNATGG